MYRVVKKLIIKLIMLAIVTILPISIYLYTRDNSKGIFNYISETNKYIIIAEFKPEERRLDIEERVIFTNTCSELTSKAYFYLCPHDFDTCYIDIKNIKINGINSKFKLIGKSKNILMVYLGEPVAAGETVYIDITATIKTKIIETSSYHWYNLPNWYPILVNYEDNRWNFSSYNYEISNYHVEFITPKDYIPLSSGRIVKEVKIKDKMCYFIDGLNIREFTLTVLKLNTSL